MAASGFRFGLEGEYLLVEAGRCRPLWHPDLSFERLCGVLESIRYEGILGGLTLDGLELDPPHRSILPYCVEGYGLPGAELLPWVDMLVKGVEIRTPVCPSIGECLRVYEALYRALQQALGGHGYRAVALAHHPLAWEFQGPQNHPRHDWWLWGMRAMTTYGPDVNLRLPEPLRARLDWAKLQRRANHYVPALVAFALAAPVARGGLWQVGGRTGLSARTYRRSPFAPAVAAHPKEQGRLEFKAFDMPVDREDFAFYLLLWLWLVLDDQAPGEADDADRISDLGAVARLGWGAGGIAERAEELLDRAERLLAALEVDPAPLQVPRRRLRARLAPAHDLIRQWEETPSVEALLAHLDRVAAPVRS
jgi:carboxylate-amine ligase